MREPNAGKYVCLFLPRLDRAERGGAIVCRRDFGSSGLL